MKHLPGETDVAAALEYLAQTDETRGKLAGRVKQLEHQAKVIRSLEFLDAKGTMAEKEAHALASQAYRAWIEDYENAVAEFETIKARRLRAELTIEVWRSVNANRRQAA